MFTGTRTFLQLTFTFLKTAIETLEKSEICSKLTIKIPERRRSGVFIVNFEHIFTPFSSVSIIDFEIVNVSCDVGKAARCR